MPINLDDEGVNNSTSEAPPAEPDKDLPYFSLHGETKELPYTHDAIQYLRKLKHGLLPVAEKMEAGIDMGFQKLAEGLGGDKAKSWQDTEKEYLDQYKKASDETGMIGSGVELAGAIFSPINKLIPGAGVVPKSILGAAGKIGATSAAAGGAQAALAYGGETPTGQLTPEGALKATGVGMLTGGVLGTGGGAFVGKLAKAKDDILLKAIASSAGDVRIPGKGIGATSKTEELKKALDIAKGAEHQGLIGEFGQNLTDTHGKAVNASTFFGKEGEIVRNELVQAAQNSGAPTFGEANKVMAEVLSDVTTQLKAKGRLSPGELEGLQNAKVELQHGLMNVVKDPIGNPRFDSTTPVGLAELHQVYSKIKTALRGEAGRTDFANSTQGQVLRRVESKLKNIFREEAVKVDPHLAKKLEELDKAYHIAQSVETMTASGRIAEGGQRPLGGMMGRVGNISGMMLGSLFGRPGVLAGRGISGKLSQRTVAPNMGPNLLHNAKEIPWRSGVAGGQATKLMSPADPEDY
jgi:hypothetical protein